MTPLLPSARPSLPTGVVSRVAGGLGAAVGKSVRWATFPYRMLRSLAGGRRPHSSNGAPLVAAELAADEGLTQLATALSDRNPMTRMLALDVICEFSEERAARLISSMLHDPDPRVRCASAAAAARVHSTGTIFSLILALEDEQPEVVDAAAEAIRAITGKAVDIADASAAERSDEIEKLKLWWKEQRVVELARELEV